MSDEHHGATLLLLQANKEIKDRLSIFAVKITGRFIREKQGWTVRKTSRNGDALALAAGKLGRKMIESMIETNQLQQFKGAIAPLRS
jgi:hypothetical protein